MVDRSVRVCGSDHSERSSSDDDGDDGSEDDNKLYYPFL
jgi:hypothetical protein